MVQKGVQKGVQMGGPEGWSTFRRGPAPVPYKFRTVPKAGSCLPVGYVFDYFLHQSKGIGRFGWNIFDFRLKVS